MSDDPMLGQLRALLLLPRREGLRRDVYEDSTGNLTVGIGHKVLPEDGLQRGQVISPGRVEQFFQADGQKALDAARAQAMEAGIDDADFLPYLGAVNFQLGDGWRKQHTKTWQLMKNGEYAEAADEVTRGSRPGTRSKWHDQTPVRVEDFQGALMRLAESGKQRDETGP